MLEWRKNETKHI